jgi:hypothetical protein
MPIYRPVVEMIESSRSTLLTKLSYTTPLTSSNRLKDHPIKSLNQREDQVTGYLID